MFSYIYIRMYVCIQTQAHTHIFTYMYGCMDFGSARWQRAPGSVGSEVYIYMLCNNVYFIDALCLRRQSLLSAGDQL